MAYSFRIVLAATLLTGCSSSHTPASHSDLQKGRPFPGPADVCQTIVQNPATLRLTSERHDLIACPNHERGAISDRISDGFYVVGSDGAWTLLQQSPMSTAPIVPATRSGIEHLLGKTVVFYDEFHGTQVAYYAPNDIEYLWYPGNQTSLLGYWQITSQQICFQYPNSGINPATGVPGHEWECSPLQDFSSDIIETVDGDIFSLASGKIPFVMRPKHAYTLKNLRSQIGI